MVRVYCLGVVEEYELKVIRPFDLKCRPSVDLRRPSVDLRRPSLDLSCPSVGWIRLFEIPRLFIF